MPSIPSRGGCLSKISELDYYRDILRTIKVLFSHEHVSKNATLNGHTQGPRATTPRAKTDGDGSSSPRIIVVPIFETVV
ncbi:protein of unknown function [Acidithiobacillus ferrivorans]|uniref:Uncharacterized protein n=1 Tax=Acidithiobacillus ferrivorans TaxID=160808 RepID=A0ABY1MUM0_9PROT|nr:protein of unknown function [Acidithiobacillus ferrivorans]